MVKVLTIRDPETGALLAEEQIQPKEDTDVALARIYRRSLGPDAPEMAVTPDAVWIHDREMAERLGKELGDIGLALVGPKGEKPPGKSRLVLARVWESTPKSRMDFPTDKRLLEATKSGRRHDAVVPVNPESPPTVGDTVTFVEARSDPFGIMVIVPNGDAVSVQLTEVRNQHHKWVGHDLYYIAWDPAQTKKASNRSTAPRPT